MATTSQAKADLQAAKDRLAGLPSTYAGVISTVQAFDNPNSFNTVSKAGLTALTAEFTALDSAISTAIAAI